MTVNNWLDMLAGDHHRGGRRARVGEEPDRRHRGHRHQHALHLHARRSRTRCRSRRCRCSSRNAGRLYPQHFAMVALGFATGLAAIEPPAAAAAGSGAADVRWDENVVLVRRSQTAARRGDGGDQEEDALPDHFPDDLMAILAGMSTDCRLEPMRDSESAVSVRDGRLPVGVGAGQAVQGSGRGDQPRKANHPTGDAADLSGSRSQRRHRDHRPAEDLRSRDPGDVRPLQHGPPKGDSGGCRGGHLAREVPRASTGRCIVV